MERCMSEGVASQTAFITGGSSGIGLALARQLARTGAKLALVDRNEETLNQAVAEMEQMQAKAIGLVCDVGDRAQVFDAASRAANELGPIDILVNNAGVGVAGPIGEISSETWDWVMRVNLMGVIYGLEAVVPAMKARGRGYIINTASMAGMRGAPFMGPYCASKAAVVSLSETLYGELQPYGIGVSVLCPGFVKTSLHLTSMETDPSAKSADVQASPFTGLIEAGIPVEAVAARIVEAMANRELYIFTHPDYAPIVNERYAKIREAFEMAAASPALGGLNTQMPSVSRG
jgi:NAD(P)-dependent dehydrogenase (short-subunit alcohol dehydrogenase family)